MLTKMTKVDKDKRNVSSGNMKATLRGRQVNKRVEVVSDVANVKKGCSFFCFPLLGGLPCRVDTRDYHIRQQKLYPQV